MAPKGKAAPAAAPPARTKNKITCTPKWIILTTIALICLIVFAITLSMYIKMASKKKNPLEEPMKKLRKTISEGLRNKPFNYASPSKVADEVSRLPTHISDSENNFRDQKARYRKYPRFYVRCHEFDGKEIDVGLKRIVLRVPESLFKKGARTSGAWKVFERSLYYISTEKKTWHDAESFCMSRDSHLASINTDKEQNYISSQLDEPAWIGLTDENEEGNWKWSDGSRVFSEFWARGSPRRTTAYDYGDMDNDCTFIQPFSLSEQNWKDFNCEALYRWVCKESLSIDTP